MDKSKHFLDLSKCTEEHQRVIRMILYKNREYVPFFTNLFDIDRYYKLHFDEGDWLCGDAMFNEKTELTYPEFIKLFEGGESDGWIKIESEADLPKESGDYFVFTKDRNTETIYVDGDISVMEHTSQSWIRNFTHYQPIQKPEPPKF